MNIEIHRIILRYATHLQITGPGFGEGFEISSHANLTGIAIKEMTVEVTILHSANRTNSFYVP